MQICEVLANLVNVGLESAFLIKSDLNVVDFKADFLEPRSMMRVPHHRVCVLHICLH